MKSSTVGIKNIVNTNEGVLLYAQCVYTIICYTTTNTHTYITSGY